MAPVITQCYLPPGRDDIPLVNVFGLHRRHAVCNSINNNSNKLWGAGVVVCLEQGADLHTTQLMPLPLTVSCFSKIQIGLTFLVPAHPGSPGQKAVKWVCVCVCVCNSNKIYMVPVFSLGSQSEALFRHISHVAWSVCWAHVQTTDEPVKVPL